MMTRAVFALTALMAVCAALHSWQYAAMAAMRKFKLPKRLRVSVNAATRLLHDEEWYTGNAAPDEATLLVGAMLVVAEDKQSMDVRAAAAGSDGHVGLVARLLKRGAMGAVTFSDQRAIDLLADGRISKYSAFVTDVFARTLDAPAKCEGWVVSDDFVMSMIETRRFDELSVILESPCEKTYGALSLLADMPDRIAAALAAHASIEALREVLSMPKLPAKRIAIIEEAVGDRVDIAALRAGRASSRVNSSVSRSHDRESVERINRERLARDKREHLARLKQERQALLEQERQARDERERQARDKKERLARVERERQARDERERLALLRKERLALFEQNRLARIEKERLEIEEMERLERERLELEAMERADIESRLYADQEAKKRAEEEAAKKLAEEESKKRVENESKKPTEDEANKCGDGEAESAQIGESEDGSDPVDKTIVVLVVVSVISLLVIGGAAVWFFFGPSFWKSTPSIV